MSAFVGVFFAAIGCVGLVQGARRRLLLFALCSLVYLILGVGLLQWRWELEKAMNVIPILIALPILEEGIRARSAKTILVAIAVAAAGVGLLAGLFTASTVVFGWMTVYGVWGLVRSIRARATGGMFWFGGVTAMGIITALPPADALLGIEFIAILAGFVAMMVGILLDGWRIPLPGEQQSPPAPDSTPTTDN